MSNRGDKEILKDMEEAITRIKIYVTDLNYEMFLNDMKTQDAVTRNLEIIGEAVKNLSSSVKDKYKAVPWKKIAGIRDRLIHHYFGVNFEIIWTIIQEELMDLNKRIQDILVKLR